MCSSFLELVNNLELLQGGILIRLLWLAWNGDLFIMKDVWKNLALRYRAISFDDPLRIRDIEFFSSAWVVGLLVSTLGSLG